MQFIPFLQKVIKKLCRVKHSVKNYLLLFLYFLIAFIEGESWKKQDSVAFWQNKASNFNFFQYV